MVIHVHDKIRSKCWCNVILSNNYIYIYTLLAPLVMSFHTHAIRPKSFGPPQWNSGMRFCNFASSQVYLDCWKPIRQNGNVTFVPKAPNQSSLSANDAQRATHIVGFLQTQNGKTPQCHAMSQRWWRTPWKRCRWPTKAREKWPCIGNQSTWVHIVSEL